MINAAVIDENVVTNIIYIDDENMQSFIEHGWELIDSALHGLTLGDYREGDNWYRDVDGVKTQLPLPEPETEDYEAYYTAISNELGGGNE